MPAAPSVQLPDFLSLSRAFDLRTNRHCFAVTSASEQWFTTQENVLNEDERAGLRSMKIGLWAACVFPTCDSPHLRLATDFLTALVTCNARLARAQTLRDCGWTEERSPDSLGCLSENLLFRHFMPKIASVMPSELWREKFCRSCEAFRAAQMQMLAHRQNNTLPGVDAYVELRRDLSGLPMVLDLIQMAEGLNLTVGDEWDSLNRFAADIVALSIDIFAYNNDQFIDNNFNIVSIIRADRGVSVQVAINAAFALVEQSFQNFLAAESTLFLGQDPAPSARLWSPLSRMQPPVQRELPADSKIYLHGLKDCIVGTLNWSYETELYFGSKGDEVRQFGWVFLRVKEPE
ncbi:isoprenoid synthase domain-containing protein [Mycena epipterygia]|nr:isoprenoid synthase domain-containing protein [Mycena epipterygia]